jgi:hypothetical protein
MCARQQIQGMCARRRPPPCSPRTRRHQERLPQRALDGALLALQRWWRRRCVWAGRGRMRHGAWQRCKPRPPVPAAGILKAAHLGQRPRDAGDGVAHHGAARALRAVAADLGGRRPGGVGRSARARPSTPASSCKRPRTPASFPQHPASRRGCRHPDPAPPACPHPTPPHPRTHLLVVEARDAAHRHLVVQRARALDAVAQRLGAQRAQGGRERRGGVKLSRPAPAARTAPRALRHRAPGPSATPAPALPPPRSRRSTTPGCRAARRTQTPRPRRPACPAARRTR